jgi:capsular polysaccharide biosynthesis protein
MINLLPKSYKSDIHAARANVILIRYSIIIVFAFIFLVLILAGSIILLSTTKESSEKIIEVNASNAAKYQETATDIKNLTDSLNSSRVVLDQQVEYSKVLTAIGGAMPTGTIIGKLEVSDTSFDGAKPTVITVYATNNDTAGQLTQALQSVPGVVNAKIDSISATGGITNYPVSATLTVTFGRGITK